MRVRSKRRKYKGLILLLTLVLVVVSILSIKVVLGLNNDNNMNYIGSELGETLGEEMNSNKDNITYTEPSKNNSGYLSLGDDKHADDGTWVMEITNALIKGEKRFPVRNDGKKGVYLTFDDGPSTKVTPEILNILDKYNAKGTFFVLGTSLENNTDAQDVLRKIAKNGHAIGSHGYSHDYKKLYPNNQINVDNFVNDFNRNNEIMKDILGQDFSTEVIRFPGGYWSWRGREHIRPYIDKNNIHIIEWNVITKDSEGPHKNASEMLNVVKQRMSELGPNVDHVVLLMHDINSKVETVKALPLIIEYYSSLGFEFRTIK